MPDYQYDPASIARYFDEFSDREWQRLVSSPANEISLFLHTHYLKKHLRPGMRVLEIGAGAGRFTQLLSEVGVRVVVGDLSVTQLELNRKYATTLGFNSAVEGRLQLDICEMSCLPDGVFDAVVAYGGPLSYALDRRGDALHECRRVLRTEGLLLLSVMCLWGSVRRALRGVLVDTPSEVNWRIIESGDISPANYPDRQQSFMHLFHSWELVAWLGDAGFTLLDLSASGCLASGWDASLDTVRVDDSRWNELLEMELQASVQPGCLDMGTHLIAATRKG